MLLKRLLKSLQKRKSFLKRTISLRKSLESCFEPCIYPDLSPLRSVEGVIYPVYPFVIVYLSVRPIKLACVEASKFVCLLPYD